MPMRLGNKVSMSEEEATPHGRKLHSLTIPPFAMSTVAFNAKKIFFKKKKKKASGLEALYLQLWRRKK